MEKKFTQEEKELPVLDRYCGVLKNLAQGQSIKVLTGSQIPEKRNNKEYQSNQHKMGLMEDFLLDSDLENEEAQTICKKQLMQPSQVEPPEQEFDFNGSRKGPEDSLS